MNVTIEWDCASDEEYERVAGRAFNLIDSLNRLPEAPDAPAHYDSAAGLGATTLEGDSPILVTVAQFLIRSLIPTPTSHEENP